MKYELYSCPVLTFPLPGRLALPQTLAQPADPVQEWSHTNLENSDLYLRPVLTSPLPDRQAPPQTVASPADLRQEWSHMNAALPV